MNGKWGLRQPNRWFNHGKGRLVSGPSAEDTLLKCWTRAVFSAEDTLLKCKSAHDADSQI